MIECILSIFGKATILYLLSLLFGSIVGFAELLNKYREGLGEIITSLAAMAYIALNGLSSMIAFYLLNRYSQDFFDVKPDELKMLMIAGFSSMFFLRSSFFTMKNNNQDIPIGPAAVLTIIMNSADRAFDRERAKGRAKTIEKIMRDVDFKKAKKILPLVCLNLMQNLSLEEQKKMGDEIAKLELEYEKSTDPHVRKAFSISLGLKIEIYTGPKVLEEAVNILTDDISIKDEDMNIKKIDELMKKFMT